MDAPATARTDHVRAYKQAEGTRTGSEREQEILRHLPLVQTVVDRLCAHPPATVERDDLFQAGVVGLIDALSRFDASRDNAFSTYAVLRIRGQVIDELRARDWIPRGVRERARDYLRAVSELTQRLGRSPDDRELAARLGVAERDLPELEAHAHLAAQVSLDAPEGEDTAVASTIPHRGEDAGHPGRFVEQEDRKRMLVQALTLLNDQERMVLKLYYFEDLLMKEIAAVLGVTESRVCQIHARAVAALRTRLGDIELW
jgi:RNA polymerase sigma factor for flagellar operon FliA